MRGVRRFLRPVSCALVLSMFAFTCLVPAAHASMISTATVLRDGHAEGARLRLEALLKRRDVVAYLTAHGVAAAAARMRVASLSDRQVLSIADRMNALPAGGDVLGLLVLVFLVLLLTDILGFTDIFPFVKHHARH